MLCMAFLLLAGKANSQNEDRPWLLGFGIHFVDYTSVDPMFEGLYDTNDFNSVPGISKLDIGRSLSKSFTLELSLAAATVNKSGNRTSGTEFFADVDLLGKFNFINKTKCWFDPYIAAGPGFSKYDTEGSLSLNAGIGSNFWLSEGVGVRAQTMYNASSSEAVGDYFHHTLGLVLRFGSGKDTDKDGIVDKEDKCPTVAGIEKLMGCPDKDGDMVADLDDVCPDIKGLVSLKGCPDGDGDGIADKDDSCPELAGLAELNGCPDKDADGIADKDDKCPDAKGLAAMSGCPDTDGDGISDPDDQCPKEKGTTAMAGCPDRDGDGVADKDDKCPDVIGLKTNNGCPAMDVEVIAKISFAAKAIQFETGKDVIKKSSHAKLDTVVNIMKKYQFTSWSIEGHTDNTGNAAKNLQLSKDRAASVKKYFVNQGIDAGRLTSEGYGDTKPIGDNKTSKGRAENRRVEIKLNE